jgi:hypothetical protein
MIVDKNGRRVPDPFAAQQAARKKGIVMKENLVKNLRKILESEVTRAEVMMGAKEFAYELQEMIEKIGRLQNEDLPPVTDQMRETYGHETSSAFQTQIYGSLQGVMDALYSAKNQIDDAVGDLAATGQIGASVDMEKNIDVDAEVDDMMGDDLGDIEADLDNIDDEGMADDFGGAEAENPLGREMKAESVQRLEQKVMEMRKLVEKARKLKEAQCSMDEDDAEELEEVTKVFHNGSRVPKGHPDADTQRPAAAAAAKAERAKGNLRRGGDHESSGSVSVARRVR